MTMLLFLALQAAAAPAPAPPPVAGSRWFILPPGTGDDPRDFDLANYRLLPDPRCAAGGDSDVTVCGQRRGGAGSYPLERWARIFAPRPIRAEMSLGGGATANVRLDAVPMDRGAVSNRVLIGIGTRF